MQNEIFEIIGGSKLGGTTKVYSAKNAVLPMLAGAMLTKEKVTIKDCSKEHSHTRPSEEEGKRNTCKII